jgi:2-amino-4-hydroxy-6-hydroxymethyldihydropteridine diphosphokinase
MTTVYLALGSNVGDSRLQIEEAVRLLGRSVSDIVRASLYRSKAVGYTEQADFINTAVRGRTALKPRELLAFIKGIEGEIGRVQRFRFGPREIDIDLIFYGDLISTTDDLTIPHPAFRERDFVLQPLADLDPELKDPVSGHTVSELLKALKPEDRSVLGP